MTTSTPDISSQGPRDWPDEVVLARFMAEAARILGDSLDFEETLGRVASLAVPRISDWCAVELLTEDGQLEELALAHADPAKVHVVHELRRLYPADPSAAVGAYAVVRSGESQLVTEITPEMIAASAVDERQAALVAELDLRSFMCVPLRVAGRVLGALTMATDGSGRLFTEIDLAAAEDLAGRAATAINNAQAFKTADRFRRILDTVAEAVFIIEPVDGRIRDVNRGAVDLLGVDRAAIAGRPIWDFAVDVDASAARRLIRPLIDGEIEARTITAIMRDESRPGGPGRPVEVLIQRVVLPGEAPALVAIARDISERIEAQARLERLAEAEHTRAAELDAVIRSMGDAMIVCEADGRQRLANPAARALFPDLTEPTYAAILARLHDPQGLAPVLGRRGGPVVLPTRDEPTRWFEVSSYPVGDPSGDESDAAPREAVVVLHEVTEARQREAIRETFIGILSHELRTPVTTIYGGAKVLARADSTLDEATRRAIFSDIAAEAERLQRLVEDVVALSRFGEPGGDLGQEPVLLQRTVPGVVESERARWPGVEFATRIPVGLPTVTADRTYVEQVLRNLLSNAAKYSDPGSTVEVIVEPGGSEVAVRILDDGRGIDPAEADRLFELFYRSPLTAGTTAGAGIGLFVCARLIDAMGGRIWARPRLTGGSEFGFALRAMTDD